MSRYTSAKNVLKAINDKLVTVTNVQLEYEDAPHAIESIEPEQFITDLEFYSKSGVFSDTIDLTYTKTGKRYLVILAERFSTFLKCRLVVNMRFNEGIEMEKIEEQLGETIFTDIIAQKRE